MNLIIHIMKMVKTRMNITNKLQLMTRETAEAKNASMVRQCERQKATTSRLVGQFQSSYCNYNVTAQRVDDVARDEIFFQWRCLKSLSLLTEQALRLLSSVGLERYPYKVDVVCSTHTGATIIQYKYAPVAQGTRAWDF